MSSQINFFKVGKLHFHCGFTVFMGCLDECTIHVLKTNEAVIMTKTGIVSLYN